MPFLNCLELDIESLCKYYNIVTLYRTISISKFWYSRVVDGDNREHVLR